MECTIEYLNSLDGGDFPELYRKEYLSVKHAFIGKMSYGYLIEHDYMRPHENIITVVDSFNEAVYVIDNLIYWDRCRTIK